jgi:hypothetical protein
VAAIEKVFAEAVALYKRGQLAHAASACEAVLKVAATTWMRATSWVFFWLSKDITGKLSLSWEK